MIFRNLLTIAASLALALAVAVPSQAALSPEDKTSIKDVKRETRELIKSIRSYSAEQRDQAIQEIEVAIVRLDQRIDALQNRIDSQWGGMTEEAREKARSSLDGLQQQRQELAGWYDDLKNSSANAWADIRKGFSKAYRNINNAWERALNEFGDSEAS
jgi:TolA-binding protein